MKLFFALVFMMLVLAIAGTPTHRRCREAPADTSADLRNKRSPTFGLHHIHCGPTTAPPEVVSTYEIPGLVGETPEELEQVPGEKPEPGLGEMEEADLDLGGLSQLRLENLGNAARLLRG